MARKIEISYRTIVFTILFLISLWFLYFIKDVLFQIFVALLIMTILNPPVTRLHKKGIPRAVSVMIVYLLVILLISLALILMAGPLIDQTTTFANSLPRYMEELKIPGHIADKLVTEMTSQVASFPSQFLRIGISVFSNVMAVLTVFIFALYFLLSREKLDEQLAEFFKDGKTEERIERTIQKLEQRLGGWARGQIILMALVGITTYIGLIILGVPFALPLALIAGILEIIPNIGPFLAGVPAVIIAFGVSPVIGIGTAALAILIQQLENYLLVPKIMEKSAGVSPVVTLVSLLIGLRVAGIVGALLSVPVVITIHVILEEYFNSHKNNH